VASVTNWTKNKNINIFEKKLIFIPVNKDLHWSLCVVVNPGAIEQHQERAELLDSAASIDELDFKDDAMPCILFLDPMKSYHPTRTVVNNLRQWLNSEWKRIKNPSAESGPFDARMMAVFSPTGMCSNSWRHYYYYQLAKSIDSPYSFLFPVPYQNNGWDCGVFVCRYAYAMFGLRKNAFSYVDAQLPTKRRGKAFDQLITKSSEFCFDMRDIARIRVEMKLLIRNLSEVYLRWKDGEDEKKRMKKALRKKALQNSRSSSPFNDNPASGPREVGEERKPSPVPDELAGSEISLVNKTAALLLENHKDDKNGMESRKKENSPDLVHDGGSPTEGIDATVVAQAVAPRPLREGCLSRSPELVEGHIADHPKSEGSPDEELSSTRFSKNGREDCFEVHGSSSGIASHLQGDDDEESKGGELLTQEQEAFDSTSPAAATTGSNQLECRLQAGEENYAASNDHCSVDYVTNANERIAEIDETGGPLGEGPVEFQRQPSEIDIDGMDVDVT